MHDNDPIEVAGFGDVGWGDGERITVTNNNQLDVAVRRQSVLLGGGFVAGNECKFHVKLLLMPAFRRAVVVSDARFFDLPVEAVDNLGGKAELFNGGAQRV